MKVARGMTGGVKRPKAPTISKLKKELDRVFSLYIRKVHQPACYTCGVRGKALQCGHFISRNYLATRYSEDNCRPQCIGCNIFGNGKPFEFEENLIVEIGRDRVDELKKRRNNVTILSTAWYQERIDHYKSLI